jgi:hypothetical protein
MVGAFNAINATLYKKLNFNFIRTRSIPARPRRGTPVRCRTGFERERPQAAALDTSGN